MLTAVLQGAQGLKINAFVMLVLVMISLHTLTLRLIVTMIAEFGFAASSSFKAAYLNNQEVNEFESLHVEIHMHHTG